MASILLRCHASGKTLSRVETGRAQGFGQSPASFSFPALLAQSRCKAGIRMSRLLEAAVLALAMAALAQMAAMRIALFCGTAAEESNEVKIHRTR